MTQNESILFTFSLPVPRWQVLNLIRIVHAFDLSNLTYISTKKILAN